MSASTSRDKLDAYGIDQIIADLEDGTSLRSIAKNLGVGYSRLHEWLHGTESRPAPPDQSARVYHAMKAGAEAHEALALEQLNIRHDLLDNPGVAGALVSLAKERAQAHWRMASVRDPSRFSDRRSGDIHIDARKQLQNLTIVSVPTTPGGGMRALPPGPAVKVGVPPSDAVLNASEVFDAVTGEVPVPDFENSEKWGES